MTEESDATVNKRVPPTATAQEKVYRLRGGSIELPVELPGAKVTSIIWKHNKDKAAEWFEEDGDEITYFGKFQSVTVLNKKTWGLNISDLQPIFNGIYSAEVNNKDSTMSLTLEVIGEFRCVHEPLQSHTVCHS